MYLCTMYSGNRICQPQQPLFVLQNVCMYLCTMYTGNRTCQQQQSPLHCKKYLHVFGHQVSPTIDPFALQKALICIILQTRIAEAVTNNSLPISNSILFLQEVPTLVSCILCIKKIEYVTFDSLLCTAEGTHLYRVQFILLNEGLLCSAGYCYVIEILDYCPA